MYFLNFGSERVKYTKVFSVPLYRNRNFWSLHFTLLHRENRNLASGETAKHTSELKSVPSNKLSHVLPVRTSSLKQLFLCLLFNLVTVTKMRFMQSLRKIREARVFLALAQ